jgi:hypothetical protein
MADLILEPTTTAQWQRLVQEASANTSRRLDEELESYLVFLLARFCGQTELLERIIALEYLRGLEARGRIRNQRLREVGDQCLLFAGLFPHLARRKLVRISYFVQIGCTAYRLLAEALNHSAARLYGDLSSTFVILMDVLHSMRDLQGTPCLSPLDAMDLWQETGSRHALMTLRGYAGAHTFVSPVDGTAQKRH